MKRKRKVARAGPKNKRAKSPTKRPSLRNAEQYFAMPEDKQLQWNRTTHVLQKMRAQGVSLSQAAREMGVPRKKVIELGGSALKKQANGRYAARSFDRLLRVLIIPSPKGLTEVAVRDSRTASKIGEYNAAVQEYVRRGNPKKLQQFKKLKLKDASGNPIRLLIDRAALMRLGHAGVLSFESIYARSR